MHELAITQNIVEICESHAAGRRVRSVSLVIGALSGVVPEAVEFCFEACSRDTLLEGARLLIDRIPARARCRECATEQAVASYHEACAACAGYGLELLSGEELRVKELEVV
jgi:hydrogenase nickel incorporation protein HypA/HybF